MIETPYYRNVVRGFNLNVMYKIELTNWYQETNETQKEFYNNLDFQSLEEACKYLGENIEDITEVYPVESIEIKYVN